MKKITLLIIATMVTVSTLSAQNYMVVNSKKIFDSMSEYTQALDNIETLAEGYQANVDKKFDEVEALYNSYMQRQSSLNTTERKVYEAKITQLEADAVEYQESIFAANGQLMQKRLEMLSPIQTKAFDTIESYAKANGFDLVLDEATTSSIIYRNDYIDRTKEIIMLLKK